MRDTAFSSNKAPSRIDIITFNSQLQLFVGSHTPTTFNWTKNYAVRNLAGYNSPAANVINLPNGHGTSGNNTVDFWNDTATQNITYMSGGSKVVGTGASAPTGAWKYVLKEEKLQDEIAEQNLTLDDEKLKIANDLNSAEQIASDLLSAHRVKQVGGEWVPDTSYFSGQWLGDQKYMAYRNRKSKLEKVLKGVHDHFTAFGYSAIPRGVSNGTEHSTEDPMFRYPTGDGEVIGRTVYPCSAREQGMDGYQDEGLVPYGTKWVKTNENGNTVLTLQYLEDPKFLPRLWQITKITITPTVAYFEYFDEYKCIQALRAINDEYIEIKKAQYELFIRSKFANPVDTPTVNSEWLTYGQNGVVWDTIKDRVTEAKMLEFVNLMHIISGVPHAKDFPYRYYFGYVAVGATKEEQRIGWFNLVGDFEDGDSPGSVSQFTEATINGTANTTILESFDLTDPDGDVCQPTGPYQPPGQGAGGGGGTEPASERAEREIALIRKSRTGWHPSPYPAYRGVTNPTDMGHMIKGNGNLANLHGTTQGSTYYVEPERDEGGGFWDIVVAVGGACYDMLNACDSFYHPRCCGVNSWCFGFRCAVCNGCDDTKCT